MVIKCKKCDESFKADSEFSQFFKINPPACPKCGEPFYGKKTILFCTVILIVVIIVG